MKRKIIVAALLFCIAFSSTSFAVTKWACVGDSITAGWKLKDPQMYYYKLGVMLGSEYEVRNYGHSARTMLKEPIEGVSYWISPMFTDSQDWNPDIVSIMLGTNDAHPNNWPLFAVEYQQDAIDMVTIYKDLPSHPRVILMKVPPAKNDGREPALSQVNEILEHVAEVTDVELVDVYSAIDNSHPDPYSENQLYKDPIHLSAISHTIIAGLLYNQFISVTDCGDGVCEGEEDSLNCAIDCGAPPECGDDVCEDSEICTCSDDCGLPPTSETSCDDGIDNDCDSLVDCNDADCTADSACICLPKGELCSSDEECCSNKCRGKPGESKCR